VTEVLGATERQVVGASIKGASHARDGRPNQDAIAWYPESGIGPRLVVALADGHGSRRCFRSDTGSRLAVAVAVALGRHLLAVRPGGRPLVAPQADVLGRRIVERWRSSVEDDLEANPLTAAELASGDGQDSFLAYGTTLMVAIVADSWAMLLQLGDGDILCVDGHGTVRRPIADDPALLADETTSLCLPSAEREFRVSLEELGPDGPEVMVLATDGFGNAYPDEESLLRVGPDVLRQVHEAGMAGVKENLAGWLETAAAHSGDDVTAAVVHLGTAPSAPPPPRRRPLSPPMAATEPATMRELLAPTVRQDAPPAPPRAGAAEAALPAGRFLVWAVGAAAAAVVGAALLLAWVLLR
jgi:serine/threonine protein phosphatase PrpC